MPCLQAQRVSPHQSRAAPKPSCHFAASTPPFFFFHTSILHPVSTLDHFNAHLRSRRCWLALFTEVSAAETLCNFPFIHLAVVIGCKWCLIHLNFVFDQLRPWSGKPGAMLFYHCFWCKCSALFLSSTVPYYCASVRRSKDLYRVFSGWTRLRGSSVAPSCSATEKSDRNQRTNDRRNLIAIIHITVRSSRQCQKVRSAVAPRHGVTHQNNVAG